MVYDLRDRLAYTQDANMRSRNQWLATLYDGEDRPNATGMITYMGNPSQLQQYVTANTGTSSNSTVSIAGTSAGSIPAGLDLAGATENGDQQAADSITLDVGFATPDTVNFTAEIVPGGTSTGTPFSNNINVVATALPPGNNFIGLTMTFYDDYSNTTDKQYATTYNSLIDAGTNLHAETLPTVPLNQAVQTIGLVTGTRVRAIETPNDLTQGNWMETASFYDDRARVVQSQSDNYKGGHDTLTTLYNFTSTPITTYLSHANPVATVGGNTRIKTNMDYDSAMRLTQVYKTLNDTSTRLLAQHAYDQMGQLLQKQIGQLTDGSFLETQAYAYNIRGWLKGINKDYANNDNSHGADNRWFGMDLSYDWGFATNQLNGNISGNKWRSKGDGYQRAYGFGYDDANRLLFADFNQYTNSTWGKTAGVDFSVAMGDGATASTAYDDNGNILGMKQTAWQIGGSNPIDRLRYGYFANSNKLQNVIDSANNPQTTLGDFRTSSLSPYATGKTVTAVDYDYDPNGNLTRDLNKDIGTQTADGIIYNHLNLPWQISVRSATGTKGTITYIYDAAGTKLKKTTFDSVGNLQTVTTYIGAFQYQGRQKLTTGSIPADTLQFIGDEEGRIRLVSDTAGGVTVNSFKYDYFLKDHLGNTRMVLTDEQETDQYPMASMEVGDSSTENLYYTMLDDTRVHLPAGYPTDTTTNPNQYVAELYSNGNNTVIGPGIVMKVMAGDQFSVRAESWYQLNGTTPGTPLNPLTDVVTALITGIAAAPGEGTTAAALQANGAPLSNNVFQFLADTGANIIDTKPHAFLNWVLFDNQFNYVSASSGFQQVGANGILTPMILTNLPITSSGYLYIYTSNATANVPVFFDNLQVTHTRGPLLEEDHYYPFGLTMAGISDKAIKTQYAENKYRFNKGSELQNKEFSDGSGLELYATEFRSLDPQLGRWWQLDPKPAEAESPYSSMGNNPILRNDPQGDEDEACCKELWNAVTTYVSDRIDNFKNNTVNEIGSLRNAVSTGLDNAKNNIEAGHTIPQELVTSFINNPLSAVTGVGGPSGIVVEGLEASATKAGGNIVETGVPQVTKNAAQGKTWETQVTKDLASEGHDKIAEQVTIKPNGVKTGNVRLDNVSMKDGKIALTDAKSSATAPFTKNQKPGYPAIEKSGGVVVGDKGASQGYPAGTAIPPTKVDIRRPQ
jgi:RHS repeat-associated protein